MSFFLTWYNFLQNPRSYRKVTFVCISNSTFLCLSPVKFSTCYNFVLLQKFSLRKTHIYYLNTPLALRNRSHFVTNISSFNYHNNVIIRFIQM
jgi:hypothetical protein